MVGLKKKQKQKRPHAQKSQPKNGKPKDIAENAKTTITTKTKSKTLNYSPATFYQTITSLVMVTFYMALNWLSCQAPGDIGSAIGLVGPVSVYYDWVM